MSEVAWQQHNDRYTASISHWQGVVIEQHDTHTFAARIETADDETLHAWDNFPDFETATRWILSIMVDVEQAHDRNTPYQRMFETLDLCKAKVAATAHPVHRQRLDAIGEWISTRSTQEQAIAAAWWQRANENQPAPALDWQALNTTDWYVDTAHGRAIIREIRPNKAHAGYAPPITHTAWIVHPTGATYDWNTTSIDFMAADAWVQTTLRELDDPRVAEQCLGNIIFTLNICVRLLTNEPDPMHTARIEYIKEMLETVLP